MHYYKLNIADWNLSTAHLSPEDEAIYFRLVNHYYDTEALIPLETQSVFNRLRLTGYEEKALGILGQFFELTDNGWKHKRCEVELKEYHQMAKKNRKNGSKGGRPKKNKRLPKTQSVTTGNPLATQTKPTGPNHKPLTINHKPITNNKDLSTKADDAPEVQIYLYWKKVMGKNGSTKFTNARRDKIKARLRDGYSIQQIKSAIDNCKSSAFHMGDNEHKTIYNDLTLICREGSNLEQFMDNLSNPEDDPPPRDLSHLDEFLDEEFRP